MRSWNCDRSCAFGRDFCLQEDAASRLASVQALRSRTDELIVMLQLLVKIRTELAHCMRDVEKARKEGRDVRRCKHAIT